MKIHIPYLRDDLHNQSNYLYIKYHYDRIVLIHINVDLLHL